MSLYLCSELEINKSVMDNAKSLYFSSCSGIARICLPETNIADSVYLVNTATEHLSCHLRSNGLGITNCCNLKVMSVWFERLDAHLFSGYMRRRIISLEELSIETDSLVREGWLIDLRSVSRKLKRFSLTLNSRFSRDKAIIGRKDATFVCEIIAPKGADVKLEGNGVDLSKYFTVTYK